MDTLSRDFFLAEIASKYYDQGKTQQEIAEDYDITRSAISRMLTEARSKGIVEIKIRYPFRTSTILQEALQTKFELKNAIVLTRENKSERESLAGIGRLGAQYLLSIIEDTSIIGISWGTGLFQLVAAMRPISYPNIHVIQLVGGMGSQNPSEIGSLLAPQLADLFGCNCHYLPAPPVADSAFTRNAYMQESSIKETLELANHADIALVGVGSTNVDVNTPLKLGIISQRENDNLINHGAVGNVCSCFYNIHGEILKTDINERIVGIELSDLKKIPVVIGISAGIKKAEGILGGLRGKHINTLFTDDSTARRILELANMD